MSNQGILWVGLGGGLGAMARYAVSLLYSSRDLDIKFPWSTLTVNLLGCLLIGILWQYLNKHSSLNAFWIIGFLGGFTTFSSFGLDGLKLFNQGAFTLFSSYVLLSNIGGLLLVLLGLKLAETL
jgi:fluoride exporter